MFVLTACGVGAVGCDLWPPPATSDELDAGLVVMYPGAASLRTELSAWVEALREAGVRQAIEVIPWGEPLDLVGNLTQYERNRAWSEQEAERIAMYLDEHPARPVTLMGYSSGAMIAILVAESLPGARQVDRVILMSPTVSRDYDLTLLLDKTRGGVVAYWSPHEAFSDFAGLVFGTMDRVFEVPAATTGFSATDERLIQVGWTPDMIRYGNHGRHFDYLFDGSFIRSVIAPFIVTESEPPGGAAARAIAPSAVLETASR